MQVNNTSIDVVHGSVAEQSVDAIVNAANTSMRGGGGIDGTIHRAAGKGLMAELQRVAPHGAKTGNVVVTGAHKLPQKYIFHTAGPVWNGGLKNEKELLARCYRSSIALADERGLESIAFCSISTGVYRFPIDQAAPLAVDAVVSFLQDHPETSLKRVVFAMFGDKEYDEFFSALETKEIELL